MNSDSTQPPVKFAQDPYTDLRTSLSQKPEPVPMPAAKPPNVIQPPLLTPTPQMAKPAEPVRVVDAVQKQALTRYEIGKKIVEWILQTPALDREQVEDNLRQYLGMGTPPDDFAAFITAAGYVVTSGRRHMANVRIMFRDSKRSEHVLSFEEIQAGKLLHEPPLKPKTATASASTAPIAASTPPAKQKPAKTPKNVDVKLGAAAAEFQHLLEAGGYEGEVTFTVKNGTAKHEANLSQVKKIKGIL